MKLRGKLPKGGVRKKQVKKTKARSKTAGAPLLSDAALKSAVIVGVIVFGLGAVLWWQFIFTSEERVFRGMLEETLNTRSVTRTVQQEAGNQSLEQISRLQFGADTAVIGQTTIEQTGETEAKVVTEEIGTPTQDYVRYTTIETTERDSEGDEIDFTDVIGVWGVSEPVSGQPQQGESFGEAMLGVLPFANVPANERRALVDMAIDGGAYRVDYLGVTKETENGRPIYTYPVMLQPEAYVTYLQAVSGSMGLTQLEDLDPAAFRGVPEIRFTVRVDMLSRQPVDLSYAGDAQREESLNSYGVIQQIEAPREVVPAQELQERIQAIQQL